MAKKLRLDAFVALLALDPERRKRFIEDPAGEMEAAGFSEEAQEVLLQGKFPVVIDYLDAGGDRPPPELQGGGGGPSE